MCSRRSLRPQFRARRLRRSPVAGRRATPARARRVVYTPPKERVRRLAVCVCGRARGRRPTVPSPVRRRLGESHRRSCCEYGRKDNGTAYRILLFLDLGTNPDFLVIGAGVAGLRAAIELARAGTVLVVAKDSLRESSSEYAQGGIAVALSDDDEIELHEQDTLAAGDGLCDRAAVRTLVEEGPAAIQELIEWGAEFDREGTRLAFTREGAHSRNRILHAHGDSTGREIARALYAKAASLPNVTFRSYAATTNLCLAAEGACGAMIWDAKG